MKNKKQEELKPVPSPERTCFPNVFLESLVFVVLEILLKPAADINTLL
jgi:hypothetical protein